MGQKHQNRERGPREAEELRMARARRALVEHELVERRFDLFQRKAWFWILAATTVAFAALTIALAIWSKELLPIGASGTTSVVAGASLTALRSRGGPRER
jgi:hypothetical protein